VNWQTLTDETSAALSLAEPRLLDTLDMLVSMANGSVLLTIEEATRLPDG